MSATSTINHLEPEKKSDNKNNNENKHFPSHLAAMIAPAPALYSSSGSRDDFLEPQAKDFRGVQDSFSQPPPKTQGGRPFLKHIVEVRASTTHACTSRLEAT